MRYNYQDQPRPNRVGSVLKNVVWMSAGGAVLLVLLGGIGVWRSGNQFFAGLGAIFDTAQPAPQVDVRSLVIRQIRSVSDLTTAVFVMEAVVPASQNREVGGVVVATTKLLYIAHGEVRAGVDLSQLRAEDIQVQNQVIEIRLPPPQILDHKIDVNRSTVYDYNRGFLDLGPDVAPDLQTLAQRESLQKILNAACSEGILQEASDRAQLAVTRLLNTAGYADVRVEVQAPAPASCAVAKQ